MEAGREGTEKTHVKGEPDDKVNLILRMMGNTAEDTILEITEDRLLLLDKDGKTRVQLAAGPAGVSQELHCRPTGNLC